MLLGRAADPAFSTIYRCSNDIDITGDNDFSSSLHEQSDPLL